MPSFSLVENQTALDIRRTPRVTFSHQEAPNAYDYGRAAGAGCKRHPFAPRFALYQAFTSTGLTVPKELQDKPRTLFADPAKPSLGQFYDQIAWFTGQNGLPALSLNYQTGGNYDFTKTAMPSRNLAPQELSWHISDHYPLWTEFSVR
jgi:hypothetical protein